MCLPCSVDVATLDGLPAESSVTNSAPVKASNQKGLPSLMMETGTHGDQKKFESDASARQTKRQTKLFQWCKSGLQENGTGFVLITSARRFSAFEFHSRNHRRITMHST